MTNSEKALKVLTELTEEAKKALAQNEAVRNAYIEELNRISEIRDSKTRLEAYDELGAKLQDYTERAEREGEGVLDEMSEEVSDYVNEELEAYDELAGTVAAGEDIGEDIIEPEYEDMSVMDDASMVEFDEIEVPKGYIKMENSYGDLLVPDELAKQLDSYPPELKRATLDNKATIEETGTFQAELKRAKELGCPEDELKKLEHDFCQTETFIDADADLQAGNVARDTRSKLTQNLKDANDREERGEKVNWEKDICEKSKSILQDGQKLDVIEGSNERSMIRSMRGKQIASSVGSVAKAGSNLFKGLDSGEVTQMLGALGDTAFNLIKELYKIRKAFAEDLAKQMNNIDFTKYATKVNVVEQAKEIKPEELSKSQSDLQQKLTQLQQKAVAEKSVQQIDFEFDGQSHSIKVMPEATKGGRMTASITVDGAKMSAKDASQNIMNMRTSSVNKYSQVISQQNAAISKATTQAAKQTAQAAKKTAEAAKSAVSKTNPATAVISGATKIIKKAKDATLGNQAKIAGNEER